MDIKRILVQEGYNVIINFKNYNFADTMNEIEKYDPVLVILDINLNNSDFDGISVAEQLLVKDHFPFIFITGNSDKETLERIKACRPHGIIIKPFKPIDISCTVNIVINNFNYNNIDVLRRDRAIDSDVPFVLKPVIKYIEDHVEQRIDIRLLCELTNYNYMHFIRMFSIYMKVTPYQYILQRKIEKAKILMTESNKLLTHIAMDLSFSSYSNFCNVFKRLTGYTPDNYRKLNSVKNYLKK
jgi:AraC-like DNA-binding protein